MSTSVKVVFSLLISILIIGVFFILVFFIPASLEFIQNLSLRLQIENYTGGSALLNIDIVTIILPASLFFTLFLIIFFLFNLRQDPVSIVQERYKLHLVSLIEKNRGEIQKRLKQGITFSSDKDKVYIDTMIDESWDDIVRLDGYSIKRSPGSPGKSGLLVKAAAVENAVIKERGGVPYVNEDALSPKSNKIINRDFKDLVDSVIKN